MNWTYIIEQLPRMGEGLATTLWLSAACVATSLLFAYLAAAILFFEVPVAGKLIRGFAYTIRNSPLLVQIFFYYYGLPEIGLRMSAMTTGLLALTIWGSAYGLTALAGAVAAVPRGILEGGAALGLKRWQMLVFCVLPLATRIVMPAMTNIAISIVKNTALLQAIGVMEFTGVAMENIAADFQTMEMFFCLLVGYLAVVMMLSLAASRFEARAQRGAMR